MITWIIKATETTSLLRDTLKLKIVSINISIVLALITSFSLQKMYPYVKCPTCGCLIGHLYRLFQSMRSIKNESNADDKNLIDVFEILGVQNYCCKTRMMTARQFNDFLHE